MSEQIPASMIHPLAPEFLSVTALYSAPIDVEAAVARISDLWGVDVSPVWDEVAGSASSPAGRILHYTQDGIVVMLTPVSGAMEVERGALPPHTFHVAVTCFVKPAPAAEDSSIPSFDDEAAMRRAGMVRAHTVLTQLLDALMREDAAVGVFRHEFEVVGVGKNGLRSEVLHGFGEHGLHCGFRAYGNEGGRLNVAVGSVDNSRTAEWSPGILTNPPGFQACAYRKACLHVPLLHSQQPRQFLAADEPSARTLGAITSPRHLWIQRA